MKRKRRLTNKKMVAKKRTEQVFWEWCVVKGSWKEGLDKIVVVK
jgi:hypothetical protein